MTGRKLSDVERWQAAGMVIGGMDLYSLANQKWTIQRNWPHRLHKTKKTWKMNTQHNMHWTSRCAKKTQITYLKVSKLYFNMTGRKLSDIERWQAAGMVIGGMSYRMTTERFNVSHSVIRSRNLALLRRLLTVRLLMRPLTIYRLHSVFALLNSCCLASLLMSLSSLRVVFRGCHVLWCSFASQKHSISTGT
jgi:hypothetical protein